MTSKVFWSMEKMIGLLYTFRRRLFWRRWHPKLCKLSQHFFFDLVWEFSDTLHTLVLLFCSRILHWTTCDSWYYVFYEMFLVSVIVITMSWGSAVSIVTGYGLDGQRVWNSSPGRGKIFILTMSFRLVLRPTQPRIQWVRGALCPGVKQLGCEPDHSPPTSAEVMKMWIYTSTPHIP
jgi:hypothetical protein